MLITKLLLPSVEGDVKHKLQLLNEQLGEVLHNLVKVPTSLVKRIRNLRQVFTSEIVLFTSDGNNHCKNCDAVNIWKCKVNQIGYFELYHL